MTDWMYGGEEVGVFDIPGHPQPKQRARKGKAGNWYTPAATVAYESAVAWNAQAAGLKMEKGAEYEVEVHLYLSAKSSRIDQDNVFKAIGDGLNQLPNFDDHQIKDHRVLQVSVKDAKDERAEVRVTRRKK